MPFIQCNGINLYYEKDGDGPQLLLINGLGADIRILTFLIEYLRSSFTVISFDMRGAGKSKKPKEPYTISQISDDTLKLIEQLCDKSLHILGYSMGGCVAMDLALRHAEVVKSLTLVSTFPSLRKPFPVPDYMNALIHRTDICLELISEVYDKLFGSKYKSRISCENYVKLRMEDINPQPTYAYLNQCAALDAFDICDDVSKISAPTTIITGDSDEYISPKNSFWLNEIISNSELHVLENVGHLVPLEAPKELAELFINAHSCYDRNKHAQQ